MKIVAMDLDRLFEVLRDDDTSYVIVSGNGIAVTILASPRGTLEMRADPINGEAVGLEIVQLSGHEIQVGVTLRPLVDREPSTWAEL